MQHYEINIYSSGYVTFVQSLDFTNAHCTTSHSQQQCCSPFRNATSSTVCGILLCLRNISRALHGCDKRSKYAFTACVPAIVNKYSCFDKCHWSIVQSQAVTKVSSCSGRVVAHKRETFVLRHVNTLNILSAMIYNWKTIGIALL